MVKARKNNRNRRATKVKQKAPRDVHKKFYKPTFHKKEIQELWDNSLTQNENLQRIGVLSDSNDVQKMMEEDQGAKKEPKPIEYMKVADIVDLNQKLSASRPNQSKYGYENDRGRASLLRSVIRKAWRQRGEDGA